MARRRWISVINRAIALKAKPGDESTNSRQSPLEAGTLPGNCIFVARYENTSYYSRGT